MNNSIALRHQNLVTGHNYSEFGSSYLNYKLKITPLRLHCWGQKKKKENFIGSDLKIFNSLFKIQNDEILTSYVPHKAGVIF